MSIGGSSMGSAASVMQGNHPTSGGGVFGFNSKGVLNKEAIIDRQPIKIFGLDNKNESFFTKGVQTCLNASLGKGFDAGLSVSNLQLGSGLIGGGASR